MNVIKNFIIQEKKWWLYFLVVFYLFNFISACKSKQVEPPLFEVLDDNRTGLHFNNKLTSTEQLNVFKYMYFYNGAGVAAGDFNNDQKIDLFFGSNQGENKLYLNEGNLKFKDVTASAKITEDGGWTTGISVVDINNDGLLDIYVCRVGKLEILNGKNQLLICQGIDANGIPTYADKAKEYGLDFTGFSTQAVFFDYDNDGDLDMYLLNHSIHQNANFGPRTPLLAQSNPYSGDHIFRNEGNNKFTDVTHQTGINSSVIGYGLGVNVSDVDLDGYPDIYIGNDFHENDYLYINQHNGTFKEDLNNRIMHTSKYSMGVDIADINNDGYPEIISMDMLAADPYILKRSLGGDDYDLLHDKLDNGYNYQYSRNNLQYNRRNGMFSEVGTYAGVHATDWSWAPLWVDFDNDGLKDLFISNGIPKRLNDIDYILYLSNQDIQQKIQDSKIGDMDMSLIDKFPKIKLPNKFYKNTGQLAFADEGARIVGDKATYSNGAVYADFDNDGDMDIVVNNIDEPALLYENKNTVTNEFLQVKLKGPTNNVNALGAKLIVFAKGEVRTYEKYPVRGFMSSMEIPLQTGLKNTTPDSIFLVWPDNSFERVNRVAGNNSMTVNYKEGLPKFNYSTITSSRKNPTDTIKNITAEVDLKYFHKENPFIEFDREPLIPHMVSREGPALCIADINKDGLDDLFIGSSKLEKPAVFIQTPGGKFIKSSQPDLDKDSVYEDVDACWVDVNNDQNPDLVIASGGNEYYGGDKFQMPRLYLNDGRGNLAKSDSAFKNLYLTASCIAPCDFNNDGFIDFFIGGRAVPWEYGKTPDSYLLKNDGTGKFTDVTSSLAPELKQEGFITKGIWFDIDKDGDKDLVVCCEWGGIDAFVNTKGSFTKKVLTEKKGWWNFILPVDINNDGNIDLVAGNLGLNSRLKASEEQPVQLYYNDFDDNGKKEQILTYYVNGKQVPFANKDELQKQIPVLKKRYLYAGDFAQASMEELFTKEKLSGATVLTANYFSNAVLVNKGNMKFELTPLPWEAQLTPYKDAIVVNANSDNLADIILVGNFYDNNVDMGRYDADFGSILFNQGRNKFTCEQFNGFQLKGQVRRVGKIKVAGKEAFVLARNNDSTMVVQFQRALQ